MLKVEDLEEYKKEWQNLENQKLTLTLALYIELLGVQDIIVDNEMKK